ncbi:MAG: zinc ribbon domain-containing protein [Gemmatimonadaceae bacterium]|nr:zinc ribbon domain-containing protein [Gemmatimonadaceae bacterium]
MNSSANAPASPALVVCPSCGTASSGRFCSTCGTALDGASCGACDASLSSGARFCHRCGTPAGAAGLARRRDVSSALPWAFAAIALVALVALVVGQRFGARPSGSTDVLDGANGQGQTVITAPGPLAPQPGSPQGTQSRAPDISQMTPAQRAERLFDRIMSESEAGRTDNVRTFMPMAVAAYQMLGPLSLDQRYDLGRIGEVGGDIPLARAQSDTILRAKPTHLLGLTLAARVARLEKSEGRARDLDRRLLAAEPAERASGLGEYLLHKADIDAALAIARGRTR